VTSIFETIFWAAKAIRTMKKRSVPRQEAQRGSSGPAARLPSASERETESVTIFKKHIHNVISLKNTGHLWVLAGNNGS
jgi:hypothetical protein